MYTVHEGVLGNTDCIVSCVYCLCYLPVSLVTSSEIRPNLIWPEPVAELFASHVQTHSCNLQSMWLVLA